MITSPDLASVTENSAMPKPSVGADSLEYRMSQIYQHFSSFVNILSPDLSSMTENYALPKPTVRADSLHYWNRRSTNISVFV